MFLAAFLVATFLAETLAMEFKSVLVSSALAKKRIGVNISIKVICWIGIVEYMMISS